MIKRKLAEIKNKTTKNILQYLHTKESSEVLTEIKKVVATGGKGVRAAIFYQGYFACGGEDEILALNCASALELFHNFALIHDDIIDNSDLRRGTPTVNKTIGNSKAILTGDLALVFANELFYQAVVRMRLSFSNRQKAIESWQKMQEEVLLGQYLDISFNINNASKLKSEQLEKEVRKIMEYKTARYSFIRPLLLAASLAKAEKDLFEDFFKYGISLGIAFQIKDDILGMFGSEEVIGKPADSDLQEGKMTLLLVKMLKKIKKEKLAPEKLKDIDWVRKKMKSTGVLQECIDLANKLVQKAKKIITDSSLSGKNKIFFGDFADYMVKREF